MFPYDSQLLPSLQIAPVSIPEVLATMRSIDSITQDGDGLKWFNWLYFQVTQAVEARVQAPAASGGFVNPVFLASLDVQFAQLYFNALKASLSAQPLPDCWESLFAHRNQTELTRIQFAFAGINAHINHDLPIALVSTCKSNGLTPSHGIAEYTDYTNLNSTLDSLIDEARHELNVRLLGDAIPVANTLEDTLAAWSVSAAREAAWNNSELLWHLQSEQILSAAFLDSLNGLTTVVSKTLLIPIPR